MCEDGSLRLCLVSCRINAGETAWAHHREIIDFAAKHRLPAVYSLIEYVPAGGLMAYGANFGEIFRRAAGHVDKILKGVKAGDLPIEQPTKFELVINLKTTKALGLTIPAIAAAAGGSDNRMNRLIPRYTPMAPTLVREPSVLVAMACVRGLNFLIFSGHGGPGWLVLPLCFPLLLVNAYRLVIRPLHRTGISRWWRLVAISIAYLVLAYPFAVLAEHRISKDLGLPISDRYFYRLMTFPIGPVLPL